MSWGWRWAISTAWALLFLVVAFLLSRARFENRCASSRTRARKNIDAEWLFSGIGFF